MDDVEGLLKEAQAIKRLLILMLVRSGASSIEISETLGVDSSTVRKMVPIRKSRRLRPE